MEIRQGGENLLNKKNSGKDHEKHQHHRRNVGRVMV
jgi:hypothetical protein